MFGKQNEWTVNGWDFGRFWISLLYQLPKKKKYTAHVHTFRWVIRTLFRYFLFYCFILIHSSLNAKNGVRHSFKWTAQIQETKQEKKKETVIILLYYYSSDESQISRRAFVDAFGQSNSRHQIFRLIFSSSCFFLFIRSFVSVFRLIFEFEQQIISIFRFFH